MAIAVQVAGATAVRLETFGTGALTFANGLLGYTRNMADVTKEAFFLDVPGDQNGGDDGPPIDIIYMGEIARIRVELTKWDDAVADYVRRRVQGYAISSPHVQYPGNATNCPTGTLMLGGTNRFMRVLLLPPQTSPDLARNFPCCFPRNPIEIGRGTKYSTLICEFEAHKHPSTGILYDEVIIATPP